MEQRNIDHNEVRRGNKELKQKEQKKADRGFHDARNAHAGALGLAAAVTGSLSSHVQFMQSRHEPYQSVPAQNLKWNFTRYEPSFAAGREEELGASAASSSRASVPLVIPPILPLKRNLSPQKETGYVKIIAIELSNELISARPKTKATGTPWQPNKPQSGGFIAAKETRGITMIVCESNRKK